MTTQAFAILSLTLLLSGCKSEDAGLILYRDAIQFTLERKSSIRSLEKVRKDYEIQNSYEYIRTDLTRQLFPSEDTGLDLAIICIRHTFRNATLDKEFLLHRYFLYDSDSHLFCEAFDRVSLKSDGEYTVFEESGFNYRKE